MIHRMLAGMVLLLALGFLAHTKGFGQPPNPPTHTVLISVDAKTAGKIFAAGNFTCPQGVTLDELTVWAFPVEGGVMPIQGAANPKTDIDNTKKTWNNVVIAQRVYKGGYAVRADGKFSDGKVISSKYLVPQCGGQAPPPPPLKLQWDEGFPNSSKAKTLDCAGFYVGQPDLMLGGRIDVTPMIGGAYKMGNAKIDKVAGWSGTVATGAGGEYQIIVSARDTVGGLWYCSPLRSTITQP
jgi:hypothetical protein